MSPKYIWMRNDTYLLFCCCIFLCWNGSLVVTFQIWVRFLYPPFKMTFANKIRRYLLIHALLKINTSSYLITTAWQWVVQNIFLFFLVMCFLSVDLSRLFYIVTNTPPPQISHIKETWTVMVHFRNYMWHDHILHRTCI